LSAHILHSGNDVGVSATAADVAVHPLPDVFIRGSDRLLEQRNGGHDLSRGTVAALIAIMLDKGRLHGVEVVGAADAFDGDDLVSRVRHGKSKAGVDAATVDVNGAGSTLAVVAALFSTGQVEILTKAVKKSGTRVDLKVMIFPVDVKCYGRGTLDGSSFFLDRGRWRCGGKKRGCRGGNACSSQMG